jgi:hypothetical protein
VRFEWSRGGVKRPANGGTLHVCVLVRQKTNMSNSPHRASMLGKTELCRAQHPRPTATRGAAQEDASKHAPRSARRLRWSACWRRGRKRAHRCRAETRLDAISEDGVRSAVMARPHRVRRSGVARCRLVHTLGAYRRRGASPMFVSSRFAPSEGIIMRLKLTAAALTIATTAVLWLPTLAEAARLVR